MSGVESHDLVSTTVETQATTQAGGFDHDGDGPPFPFVVFPLLWLALIAAVIAAVVMGGGRRRRAEASLAGERVLADRYAAGEIDEDEYLKRRSVLRGK